MVPVLSGGDRKMRQTNQETQCLHEVNLHGAVRTQSPYNPCHTAAQYRTQRVIHEYSRPWHQEGNNDY